MRGMARRENNVQHANAGIHHFAVGDYTVTALQDGVLEMPAGIVAGLADSGVAEETLRSAFRALPPRITISCFLVERAGRRVLIDSGSGSALGAGHGMARVRLAALGVAPGEIGAVLVTHAHVDHVSGLLDEAGQPFFRECGTGAARDGSRRSGWARRPWRGRRRRGGRPLPRHGAAWSRIITGCVTVRHGQEAMGGVSAHHLPGHTPGHCGWLVADGAATLLVWGDLVHLPGLQFARPEAGLVFDVGFAQAQATRARSFDMAATDRLRVAGMHLDFPTFGHVVKAAEGFAFVPEVWRPAAR